MGSKFHLSKWKTYFPQFIDKFLKIEEVEYLTHYVKFKIWQALFHVSPLLRFPNIFECWCSAVHYFLQFTQRLKTGILNDALGSTFQFFPMNERAKKTPNFLD